MACLCVRWVGGGWLGVGRVHGVSSPKVTQHSCYAEDFKLNLKVPYSNNMMCH